MRMPRYLTLRVAACLSVALLSPGCSSDARARTALGEYQAAAASNNLSGARRALLELVRIKDDVPEYWVELGKLQASMGNYNDAYYAFIRAYELDRSNVDILRAVVQLAMRSGDFAMAQSHAQELEVLSPGDPWVKLTNGWSAFTQSHYDQALDAADTILANSPYDPAAIVLKARSLVAMNREAEAMDLLIKQLKAQPSDTSSRVMLAKIYLKQENWPKVVEVGGPLLQANQNDQNSALMLIEAALRSGNAAAARQTSLKVLTPSADPALIASVLDLWANYWPAAQRAQDARALAEHASGPAQKLTYASFLSRIGSPADGIRLSAPYAGVPVNAGNAEANAVLGDAWSRAGNIGAAKSRLDEVIAFDPGNATALRGRAELELRSGNAEMAIVDAQKLVTVLPTSDRDRLLLARSYAAAGKKDWANRTLWTAFQDIPADYPIYVALLQVRKGDVEATHDLQEEFDRQREASVFRGLL
jgi:tetratricopeptide (TPR) repeat protein